MQDGKLIDVLIEDNTGKDDMGLPVFFGFVVWADAKMEDVIRGIPGIHNCIAFDTMYFVDLDPRYDRNWLRAEIEAQIKIKGG